MAEKPKTSLEESVRSDGVFLGVSTKIENVPFSINHNGFGDVSVKPQIGKNARSVSSHAPKDAIQIVKGGREVEDAPQQIAGINIDTIKEAVRKNLERGDDGPTLYLGEPVN